MDATLADGTATDCISLPSGGKPAGTQGGVRTIRSLGEGHQAARISSRQLARLLLQTKHIERPLRDEGHII